MVNVTNANGITGANFDVFGTNRVLPRAMTAFTAIAWYNSIELIILIFVVFRRYTGLYFWSLIVNTLSIVPYATGAWMKQNSVAHDPRIYNTLLTIGWILMVPGQSMVLYTRLHLISPNLRLLRFIFWVIVVSAVCLCVPTVVLNLRLFTNHPERYLRGYMVMEKIQMTLFTIQEISISCIYLWETRKLMRVIFDGKARKWMWQLVAMSILLLILDIALLTTEFLNLYMIQTTFKSLVYSFKLKIEFAVLSQIVRVIQDRAHSSRSDITHPSDLERQLNVRKSTSSQVSEVESLQHNVPLEWRLSREATSFVSPVALTIAKRQDIKSARCSVVSIDAMYPGRLG
ncbi:hypothetical protein J4E86_010257 [Alternaria arbusti]|uniref:uncharacterized protein n=1 Tax=Alternaria arbusti TaxID=232088 RepID=UPI00221E3AD7|nr:uncharacterized protein J4E86_010257 [Alternaria arbusti]KAI4941746.1 hypothetical protein J4E86_010257 [Alternaria arbusti]